MRLSLLSALISLIAGSPQAFAVDGASARASGPVTDVSTGADLMSALSLADPNCVSGGRLMAKSPEFIELMKKVSALDWYFSGELVRETQAIRWCFTPGVYDRNSETEADFFSALLKGNQRTVYRYMDSAYIDSDKIQGRSGRSIAYLILNSVLQSYLNPKDKSRKSHLIALLNLMNQLEAGKSMDRKSFHGVLAANAVLFPRTVTKLEAFRNNVNFVLASESERAELIRRASKPEDLIHFETAKIFPLLADWDTENLPSLNSLLVRGLQRSMAEGSLEEFSQTLDPSRYSTINPIEVAILGLDEIGSEKRELLFNSPSYTSYLKGPLIELTSATVLVKKNQIFASPEFQALGVMPAEASAIPLKEMIPRVVGGEQMPLPSSVNTLIRTFTILVNQAEWEQVDLHFAKNPEFYRAIRLEPQMAIITASSIPGKETALAQLSAIRKGLVSKIMAAVNQEIGADDVAELQLHLQSLNSNY